MPVDLQEVPLEPRIMVPLAPLTELPAHKHQLLTRVGPHETVVGTQVGKFLPVVARHAAKKRTFAMNHLIVGQGQNEVLGEGVGEAESDLIVVIATVDRIALHVLERVMHPPHVPLVAESESAQVARTRHTRP